MRRANVQEMDLETIDLRAVLGKAVQPHLAAAPVIVRAPILDERTKPGERHTLRPICNRLTLRPPHARQSLVQIVEGALRRAKGEGHEGRISESPADACHAGGSDDRGPFQECTARYCADRSNVAARFHFNGSSHDSCSQNCASSLALPRKGLSLPDKRKRLSLPDRRTGRPDIDTPGNTNSCATSLGGQPGAACWPAAAVVPAEQAKLAGAPVVFLAPAVDTASVRTTTGVHGNLTSGRGALQPAPYARAVAAADITELALQIGFLAGDDAVPDHQVERH